MVITFVVLLFILGLYFGALTLSAVFAFNAKSTVGRVVAIAAGLFLLVIVPLTILVLPLISYNMKSSEGVTVQAVPVPPAQHDVLDFAPAAPAAPNPPLPVESLLPAESPVPVQPSDSGSAAPLPGAPLPGAPLPGAPLPGAQINPNKPLSPESLKSAGAWRDSDIDSFTANVYPSFASAVDNMIGKLRQTLIERKVLMRGENDEVIDPETIVITAFGQKIEPLVPQITEIITKQFPDVRIRSAGNAPLEPAEGELCMHLGVSNGSQQPAAWDNTTHLENGTLSCIVHTGQGQTTLQGFVTEKPWVEGYDRFIARYPTRNFVVGYSTTLQSSESEAMTAALNDAASQAAISLNGNSYAIIDRRHVVDRFAQRLSRSYGEVWREAVLVEIPDQQSVAAAEATVAEAFQRSAMIHVSKQVGIAVLVITTIFLCLLLNWVTKGYYRSQVLLGLTSVLVLSVLLAGMFLS